MPNAFHNGTGFDMQLQIGTWTDLKFARLM